MAYLGLAQAANNAVQQHYAEMDRQKEQAKRDTLFNQQQEQYQYGLSQRPIQEQETQMRLNQMRQAADAAGAPLFLKAMKGDPTALRQYNDLHPEDPLTMVPDPKDPSGDTFIVTGKNGSFVAKMSALDALYNTAAADRAFKAGMEQYRTNADINLEAQRASDARDLEKMKLRSGTVAQIQLVDYVSKNITGGDIGKAWNMVQTSKSDPQTLAAKLYMAAKQDINNVGKPDDEIWADVKNAMDMSSGYNPRGLTVQQSGAPSGQYPWQNGLSNVVQKSPTGQLPSSVPTTRNGAPAGPDNQNLPRPQSKQDYDQLQRGVQYVAPDGSIRTKN